MNICKEVIKIIYCFLFIEENRFNTMSEAVSINTNKIQQWIVNKSDVENIRNEMMALGHDEFSIEAHIKKYKKI